MQGSSEVAISNNGRVRSHINAYPIQQETNMTDGKSKILISAAGGKVGQHVLAQLAQRNISARAGVHSEDKAAALRKTGTDAVALDFESAASISAAFKGIETLFLVT